MRRPLRQRRFSRNLGPGWEYHRLGRATSPPWSRALWAAFQRSSFLSPCAFLSGQHCPRPDLSQAPKRIARRLEKTLAPGLLVGLFLFLGYLRQTQGLRYTSAPKSAFLTGLTSVLAPLFASSVYGIRPRISEVFGLLTALAGLALMTSASVSAHRAPSIGAMC